MPRTTRGKGSAPSAGPGSCEPVRHATAALEELRPALDARKTLGIRFLTAKPAIIEELECASALGDAARINRVLEAIEAESLLAEAHETFERLGATPWTHLAAEARLRGETAEAGALV